MLIISIPKSASTSILKTLSNLHQIEGKQLFFKGYKIPDHYTQLGKYHSDMRDFKLGDINTFLQNNKIYKQHIPPSKNNIKLLHNKKKVILLRDPKDIVMAYYRAEKKRLHERRKEFENVHNSVEWMQTAENIGLLNELRKFYHSWEEIHDEKLIIQYNDLINDPKQTINSIELYFGLNKTDEKIVLAKERYSRGNWAYTSIKITKKYALKNLRLLLKKF
jgi:hypothetical protein